MIADYLTNITKAYNAGNATEHTHRPALKDLIESLATGIVATNEPRRVKCGAPDYIITKGHTPLGYIEAKDIGKPLAEVEKSEQLKRYLESLGNLVLTDYLEFRWYVAGQHRLTARLASIVNGKIKLETGGELQVRELLQAFLTAKASTVNSPKELAVRMAALARLIRDTIQRAFNAEDLTDDEPDPLHDQLDGFRKVLLHDLTPEQFADMYAQTICYGLFAARCNADPAEKFTRQSAGYALPKTNPFLRKMFNYIAGTDLDERIVWAVDDLAELLNHTDIEAILKDFGKRTRQEDPVVHFYESFLTVLRTANFLGLLEAFEYRPRSVYGMGLESTSGKYERWSSGEFPSLWRLFWNNCPLLPVKKTWESRILCPVDWVSGAALAVQKDFFKELGGFSADFFLYFEDVDFARRAKAAGSLVAVYPFIRFIHEGGGSAQSTSLQKQHFYTSQRQYFEKWRPKYEGFILNVLQYLFFLR